MHGRVYLGVALFSLLMVVASGGQNPTDSEKPIWTMEFMQVKPGMFGPTLGYLDDNWMRVREEAKREGAVLNYHRIAEEGRSGSAHTIVLLTEFKNQTVYASRKRLFAEIRKQLPANTGGIVARYQSQDLFDMEATRVFNDYSDANSVQFRLLAKD
jgi:hypothetical protein